MKLINLGCGSHYHKDWTNIDFVKSSEYVISHNLLTGIPFPNKSFDVVYHSHILEHFSKEDGFHFIKECYRILNTNGIIRIAVPDLEIIVKEYLQNLQMALNGDKEAKNNYEWINLEFFDQMVRNESGGEMKKYLYQSVLINEEYVFKRIGLEGKNIRESFFKKHQGTKNKKKQIQPETTIFKLLLNKCKVVISKVKRFIQKCSLTNEELKALKIGQFRLGGEIHQWMYDRYSLTELLRKVGFKEIKVCTAFESDIKDWETYQLDVINGEVRKPDSLFIEARKL